ncbi:MAG TPA: polysaccharide deacetylase family protein [Ferruginibacter sp.]|nr:polysaccharide deacetylase family protein [Ferruginibacter sp.]
MAGTKAIIYSMGLWLGKLLHNNNQSKVLYYHDVHQDNDTPVTDMSTAMSLFAAHIKTIRAHGFEIVDEITHPEKQILISFDDGYTGIYKNRDFFIREGIKPTVFLVTSSIGTDTFMDEEQILFLKDKGFIFQSHTHTHPLLPTLSEEQLKEEFLTSKNILENLLSEEVTGICFPEGLFSSKVTRVAKACGYKNLYCSIPGNYFEMNKFGTVQRNLAQFITTSDLEYVLHGGSVFYQKRYSKQHFSN